MDSLDTSLAPCEIHRQLWRLRKVSLSDLQFMVDKTNENLSCCYREHLPRLALQLNFHDLSELFCSPGRFVFNTTLHFEIVSNYLMNHNWMHEEPFVMGQLTYSGWRGRNMMWTITPSFIEFSRTLPKVTDETRIEWLYFLGVQLPVPRFPRVGDPELEPLFVRYNLTEVDQEILNARCCEKVVWFHSPFGSRWSVDPERFQEYHKSIMRLVHSNRVIVSHGGEAAQTLMSNPKTHQCAREVIEAGDLGVENKNISSIIQYAKECNCKPVLDWAREQGLPVE